MDQQVAIDLARESLALGLMIAMPILGVGVAVGLMIGLFQALTQIQEQTIATVLKILVMVLVAAALLPWMTIKTIEFSVDLISNIPERMIP